MVLVPQNQVEFVPILAYLASLAATQAARPIFVTLVQLAQSILYETSNLKLYGTIAEVQY